MPLLFHRAQLTLRRLTFSAKRAGDRSSPVPLMFLRSQILTVRSSDYEGSVYICDQGGRRTHACSSQMGRAGMQREPANLLLAQGPHLGPAGSKVPPPQASVEGGEIHQMRIRHFDTAEAVVFIADKHL